MATPSRPWPLPIAGAAVPENLVAPHWDDLDFSVAGARAFFHSDGSRFVVEYQIVPHDLETDASTFEVILEATGEIRFQYLHAGTPTNSATIGIQDWTRAVGLQVSFNDAAGVGGGTYSASVQISSNDPDEPMIFVPVSAQRSCAGWSAPCWSRGIHPVSRGDRAKFAD